MFFFLFPDILTDFNKLRELNPDLKIVISLGGSSGLDGSTFSSLITDSNKLSNLTSSVNKFYRDGIINGLEIDWEWPFKVGGKKDRVKLIRYARVRTTTTFN